VKHAGKQKNELSPVKPVHKKFTLKETPKPVVHMFSALKFLMGEKQSFEGTSSDDDQPIPQGVYPSLLTRVYRSLLTRVKPRIC